MFIVAPWDRVADALLAEIAAKAGTAVAFITHQSSRSDSRPASTRTSDTTTLQQRPDDTLLMPMTRREDKRHQLAATFGLDMELRAQSSATSTNSFILGSAFFAPAACWWARTVVPSTKCTSQSMAPSSSAAAWTWDSIPSQTPAFRHRWYRLYAVGHGPYRSGKSRHGAPVRSTHRIPLITSRSSFRGRPWSARLGSSGSSFSHCSFVRSPRCMPTNLPSFDQFAYRP